MPTLPRTELEIYFTIRDENFAAAAVVPVHGPAGATVQFELRQVDYGTDPPTETMLVNLNGTYRIDLNAVVMEVPFDRVGNPQVGDLATGIWAGTYFAELQGGVTYGDRSLDDRGPDSGYGREFAFTNTGPAEYSISLLASVVSGNASLTQPANYQVLVRNNSTETLTVELAASAVPNWGTAFSPSEVTLGINEDRNVTFRVYPNRTAKGGEQAIHKVSATATASDNTTIKSNELSFTTKAVLGPPPPPPPPPPGGDIGALLLQYWMYIAVVGGAAVAVLGAMSYMRSRREPGVDRVVVEFEDYRPAGGLAHPTPAAAGTAGGAMGGRTIVTPAIPRPGGALSAARPTGGASGPLLPPPVPPPPMAKATPSAARPPAVRR